LDVVRGILVEPIDLGELLLQCSLSFGELGGVVDDGSRLDLGLRSLLLLLLLAVGVLVLERGEGVSRIAVGLLLLPGGRVAEGGRSPVENGGILGVVGPRVTGRGAFSLGLERRKRRISQRWAGGAVKKGVN
jgi:hypothetical protein